MWTNSPAEAAADPAALRDKALNLRESVNSAKARMFSQREQLTRLRAEIAALRALAELRTPDAAPAPVPARAFAAPPPPRPAPVIKEAVSVSAPAPASLKTDDAGRYWKALPYAAILLVAIAVQRRPASSGAPRALKLAAPESAALVPAPPPAAIAPEDDRADEALLLAHDFRLPGDERPLSERLDSGGNPPGARPAWTSERTGEQTYLVRYQSSDTSPRYEFDVDLASRRVEPTPETAELIAPRLASSR